jgi:hypothetical protein
MSRRHFAIVGITLVALLAFPSAGHASIWDWIWSMSGPQMVGVVFHCEVDWEHEDATHSTAECRIIDRRIVGNAQSRKQRRTWLTLDTGLYTSTGKNSEGFNFEALENHMLAFEPMIEIRSYTNRDGQGVPNAGNLSFHHGLVGATYDVLFGSDYGTFDKIGFKFRPVGVTYKSINAAVNVRWYPNGFTEDEFGFGPRQPDRDRDGEWTWGFAMGFIWGPR